MPSRDNGCVVNFFSLGGADTSVDLVHYVMYEWANRIVYIIFNLCFPVLVSTLGNRQYGDHQGRIVFAYVIIISAILSSLSFITFTSVLEYGHLKRKALFRFSFFAAILLILFFLCFNNDAVFIACALAVGAKVSQSIAAIAYDSLLDAISVNRISHSISNRGYITGFFGCLTYIVIIIPILAGLKFGANVSTLWVAGIVPTIAAGVWYLTFLLRVNAYLPKDLGKGIAFEKRYDNIAKTVGEEDCIAVTSAEDGDASSTGNLEMVGQVEAKTGEDQVVVATVEDGAIDPGASSKELIVAEAPNPSKPSWIAKQCHSITTFFLLIRFGLIRGTRMQAENMIQATHFPDLSIFIVAMIFFNISTITVQSVAVIAFLEIFKVGIGYVLAAALIGIVTSIIGCIFYSYIVNKKKWLRPIHTIMINKTIIALILVWALFFKRPYEVLIAVSIGGLQAGSLGAFQRSVMSSLIPTKHQSRLFSLYHFSQESTSWIGNVVIAAIAASYGGSDRVYLNSVVFTSLFVIAVGLPLMWIIDYDRGIKLRSETDAKEYDAMIPV